MTTRYALVYPAHNVPLDHLTRAALAVVGSAYVTVVSGAGSQALRVPQDAVARVYQWAGLGPDGEEPPPAPKDTAPGPEQESPAPGAVKLSTPSAPAKQPGRPAGRAGGRAAKRTAAKKATSTKEGDDQ